MSSPRRFAPANAQRVWAALPESACECCWAWGFERGDIATFVSPTDSLLVLSGYITERRNGPRYANARQAAEFLMEVLEGESSPRELGRVLEELHGSFAAVYRNPRTKVTLCLTDRVGSRPIWQAADRDQLLISSHASSIAAAVQPRTFDPAALAGFLLYGGPVHPEHSLFRGVTKIPRGCIRKRGATGKLEDWRWYRYRHRPVQMPIAEWTEIAAERLTAAAARIHATEERLSVFFSGGVDSRLAAAALVSAGSTPHLVTLGDKVNLEVRVARRAAASLRAEHDVFWRDRHQYLRGLRGDVFAGGGSYSWKHGHFAEAARCQLADHPRTAFMLGDFCEAFSKLCCSVEAAARGPWDPEDFAKEFDTLPLPLYRPSHRSSTLELLSRKAGNDAAELLRIDLRERYLQLRPDVDDPLVLMDQFLRWDDAGSIATFLMFLDLRGVAPERNLMFDRDVHELLELLPSDIRNGANFGARLIARLAPRAAWVANSNTLLPLRFPPAAHHFSRKARPWFGNLRRWCLSNPQTNPGSWPSFEALYVHDEVWRQYFDRTIREADLLDESMFDRDAIARAWGELLQGRVDRAADIENIVALAELTKMLDSGVTEFLETPIPTPIRAGPAQAG